jgi:tRNA(Arg) A34 adenosine deaminase TadA
MLVGMACALCGVPIASAAARAPSAKPARRPPGPEETERHGILMLLTAKLVYERWTVPLGDPRLVAAYNAVEPRRSFRPYAGHNIGALAVNGKGQAVAFAMNRNIALNSPLEHAEARVLRKVIARNSSAAGAHLPYSSIFRGHAIYTTLESCSMCSGMMDLCNIGEVYYAQEDPSQKHIGDILFKLHEDEGAEGAPRPTMTSFCSLTPDITAAYRAWQRQGPRSAAGPQIISFLQSPDAYQAFRRAGHAFDTYKPAMPGNVGFLNDTRHAAELLTANAG